jgi:hypothetical protein
MKGPFIRGNRYELLSAAMLDPIATAYGVDAGKVMGGPSWLEIGLRMRESTGHLTLPRAAECAKPI